MANIIEKIFRIDKRILNKYKKEARNVVKLADKMAALSDDELRGKTEEFRQKLKEGKTLNDINKL